MHAQEIPHSGFYSTKKPCILIPVGYLISTHLEKELHPVDSCRINGTNQSMKKNPYLQLYHPQGINISL
jgi:hypothetical protein